MYNIKMYTFEICPYCEQAKGLLNALNLKYEVEVITRSELQKLSEKTGFQTVPQIFIKNELVGGFSELSALHKSGQLKTLVEEANA